MTDSRAWLVKSVSSIGGRSSHQLSITRKAPLAPPVAHEAQAYNGNQQKPGGGMGAHFALFSSEFHCSIILPWLFSYAVATGFYEAASARRGACSCILYSMGVGYMDQEVELLAPAGGIAAFHAAVRGGADAVYLGLQSFNARRGADNFTIDTFADACAFAHLRGVNV